MPEPVALLSSEKITKEDFTAFLKALGAKSDPDKIYDGIISKEEATVWLALNPEDLLNYPETTEEITIVRQKLGSMPQTRVSLDIAKRSWQSERLAAEIACKFAERWSCVVDNLNGIDWRIFSVQEFYDLQTLKKV